MERGGSQPLAEKINSVVLSLSKDQFGLPGISRATELILRQAQDDKILKREFRRGPSLSAWRVSHAGSRWKISLHHRLYNKAPLVRSHPSVGPSQKIWSFGEFGNLVLLPSDRHLPATSCSRGMSPREPGQHRHTCRFRATRNAKSPTPGGSGLPIGFEPLAHAGDVIDLEADALVKFDHLQIGGADLEVDLRTAGVPQ